MSVFEFTGRVPPTGTNKSVVVDSFPRVFDTTTGSVADTYASILAQLATAQDRDLDRLYNQRFTVSATGRALERYGEPFNVRRRTDESDTSLRIRIGTQRRVAASDTTYDDIATVVIGLLGTDRVRITPAEDAGAGTVRVTIPATAIDAAPLTRQELERQVADGVPPTHTVDLVTTDTLVLGETGSQGLGGELT